MKVYLLLQLLPDNRAVDVVNVFESFDSASKVMEEEIVRAKLSYEMYQNLYPDSDFQEYQFIPNLIIRDTELLK